MIEICRYRHFYTYYLIIMSSALAILLHYYNTHFLFFVSRRGSYTHFISFTHVGKYEGRAARLQVMTASTPCRRIAAYGIQARFYWRE